MIDTETIELEEQVQQPGFDEGTEVFGNGQENVAEHSVPEFDPGMPAPMEELQTLTPVVEEYGGDPKDWEKTFEEKAVQFYNPETGEMVNDQGESLTQQIEEKYGDQPEYLQKHQEMLEAFEQDPHAVHLTEYIEPTEDGTELHVTANRLGENGEIISETWTYTGELDLVELEDELPSKIELLITPEEDFEKSAERVEPEREPLLNEAGIPAPEILRVEVNAETGESEKVIDLNKYFEQAVSDQNVQAHEQAPQKAEVASEQKLGAVTEQKVEIKLDEVGPAKDEVFEPNPVEVSQVEVGEFNILMPTEISEKTAEPMNTREEIIEKVQTETHPVEHRSPEQGNNLKVSAIAAETPNAIEEIEEIADLILKATELVRTAPENSVFEKQDRIATADVAEKVEQIVQNIFTAELEQTKRTEIQSDEKTVFEEFEQPDFIPEQILEQQLQPEFSIVAEPESIASILEHSKFAEVLEVESVQRVIEKSEGTELPVVTEQLVTEEPVIEQEAAEQPEELVITDIAPVEFISAEQPLSAEELFVTELPIQEPSLEHPVIINSEVHPITETMAEPAAERIIETIAENVQAQEIIEDANDKVNNIEVLRSEFRAVEDWRGQPIRPIEQEQTEILPNEQRLATERPEEVIQPVLVEEQLVTQEIQHQMQPEVASFRPEIIQERTVEAQMQTMTRLDFKEVMSHIRQIDLDAPEPEEQQNQEKFEPNQARQSQSIESSMQSTQANLDFIRGYELEQAEPVDQRSAQQQESASVLEEFLASLSGQSNPTNLDESPLAEEEGLGAQSIQQAA